MFKSILLRASLVVLLGILSLNSGLAGGGVTLTPFATYHSGLFEASASEIVAHDPRSGRVFVTNASTGNIDILQLSVTSGLTLVSVINTPNPVNHVRIWDDGTESHVIAAIRGASLTSPGTVGVYSTTGIPQATYTVGAFPDMLYVTSTGLVLTANEGQPAGGNNPEGSVSIINLNTGIVQTVSFSGFNGQEPALRNQGVRIFPGIPASLDLEPEYIAVAPDNTTAYAVCQEQNSVVTIDIPTATATAIHSLGYKDHSLPGNGLDPSDSDGGPNINTWPIRGLPMPDSSVAFDVNGQTYLLTANEGGARNEDARTRTLNLDPTAYPNAGFLQANSRIGRIQASTIDGDTDGDGDFDQIYTYGTRSFSIFNMTNNAQRVFDSGDQFATAITQTSGNQLNCNHTSNNSGDGRSDNKGCEPEAATVAQIGDRTIAFIGLERQSGIMVYDVTDPPNSFFLSYFTNRNFNANIESPAAGDLGVESIVFVEADDNPTGLPMILTGNEISGTTSAFIVSIQPDPQDCNGNGVPDLDDIRSGTSSDCNGDSIPDDCQLTGEDCNNNGVIDSCELSNLVDCNNNGVPDSCELSTIGDCNNNGIADSCDIIGGASLDCDANSVPDECQIIENPALDCDLDGLLQPCETDTDNDGTEDDCDTDDDNDGVADGDDITPLDNTQCRDADMDGCDDCSSGSDDTSNDGFDFDGDGLCDLGDPDDDNDGALDDADSDDNNANVCSDTDMDGCDDCSDGSYDPTIDGADFDGDGLCDLGDTDDDNDGALDGADSDDNNANVCSDTDMDGCDDCSNGSYAPNNDGTDFDGDGLCDLGDPDDDNDGALDGADSDDNNANACSDNDLDGCDDCNGGSYDPTTDGTDFDGDGLCDLGDPDDDNDGVEDSDDIAPLDHTQCRDADMDGCDDCSSGIDNTDNDGFDFDGDGLCDLSDPDDDNDGALDGVDSNDNNPNICSDIDMDGCDDCFGGSFDTSNDGTDTDGDGTCDLTDNDIDGDGFDNSCDADVNGDGIVEGTDCNENGKEDLCDIADGVSLDCNFDNVPDECEISVNGSLDCDSDGVLDTCELITGVGNDCDSDGLLDNCEITAGSPDCNFDSIPDECQSDCDGNGIPDDCDITSGTYIDCNLNGVPDSCDFVAGAPDCNSNNILDECEPDCDADGTIDDCAILSGATDCNNNGIPDTCDIASGTSSDIHGDQIPDSCQGSPFVRGDSNRDGQMDVSDAIQILAFLFQGGTNNCQPALDFNGDENINLSDVLGSLNFVFTGTGIPAAPYPDCDWPAGLLGFCEASLLCP